MLGLLLIIGIIILILWLLGFLFSFISGPFLWIILVIGLILLIIWLLQRVRTRR
jgi:hypothetical protein